MSQLKDCFSILCNKGARETIEDDPPPLLNKVKDKKEREKMALLQ